MGMFWTGYKTEFAKLDEKIEIAEYGFWDEALKYCESIETRIKSSYLVKYAKPIEHGTKYMSETDRKFYNTFFYNTIWTTYDGEDQVFINKTKYSSSVHDDLGWLKFERDFYWKSYSIKTLNKIVSDFGNIDYDLLRKKFELSRDKAQNEFSIYRDFNFLEYRNETESTFVNFINLNNQVISIYKECVFDQRDLIICYD